MPTETKRTSNRYNMYNQYGDMHLYGNTSSAVDFPYTYGQNKPKQENTKKKKQLTTIKNKKRLLKAAACVAALFVLCITVIFRYSIILSQNQSIKQLEKDYDHMLAANQAMQAKIDKKLEIGEIEKYAKENLGMMKAQSYQMYYIDMNMTDSGTDTAFGKDEKNAVLGVPGTLMNAFRVLK